MTLHLPPEAKGKRLDRAPADALPEQSRTSVQAWIDAGRVGIEGREPSRRMRVEGGERVVIRIPPPRPTTVEPEAIPLSILYEDEHLLVVDKPSGLTVHPGSGRPDGTLANALVYHVRNLPEAIGSDRPGIVHRLDKDTSGVLVVAKSEVAQRRLSEAFAARTIKKTYPACVHGAPDDDTGVIDLPLGRSPVHRKKMAVREDRGREARTFWKVERRLPRHTLLRVAPVTGRTHQIRVHLKAIRLPIVGDPIYGNRGLPGEDLAPRLLLHAWRIAFEHPITKKRAAFEAPIPQDYAAALEALAALEPPRRR
ncbi:MAG: RluA family pseudouridine synthase [Planctomycetota bacterium]